jgi:hypothetical protein
MWLPLFASTLAMARPMPVEMPVIRTFFMGRLFVLGPP